MSERAQRALATYNPATAEKQKLADKFQNKLAKLVGGQITANNAAFDVISGKHAIEVKVLVDRKRNEITMHPESLRRKKSEARKLKVVPHTVVFDLRAGSATLYYKKGVGSFSLSSMETITNTASLKRRFGL